MKSMFIKPALSAIAAALLLGGCGALPIHATFDSLTNETSMRSSEDFNYSSFVSLSGLVPQHGVQMIFHQPDFYDGEPNSPNYSIGLAPMHTFVTERKFSMSGKDDADNAQTVAAIRDSMDEARLLSANWAALLVRRDAAESLKTLVEKDQKGKPDGDQAAILKSLLGSDVVKDDGTLDVAKAKAALDLIKTDADKLKSDLNSKLLEIKKLAATRNVVITRWARDKRNVISAGLSDWLGLNGQGHEAKSGVLVFGDIRTVTLLTGDDFIDMLKGMDKRYREFVKDSGVTVFTIQAKHGAYSADMDMEKAVSIRLNLTKDQLRSLSKTFQEINLTFSGSFGVALDLSNSAFLSSSHVEAEPRCFFPPAAYDESIKREIKASDGYQLLFAVRAQLRDELFDKAAKKKVSTPLSALVKQCAEEGERSAMKEDKSEEAEKKRKDAFDRCLTTEETKLSAWLAQCDPNSDKNNIYSSDSMRKPHVLDLFRDVLQAPKM